MKKYWIFLHHKCASQYLRAQISKAGQQAGRLTEITAFNSMLCAPLPVAMQAAMNATTYSIDDNSWPEEIRILDRMGTPVGQPFDATATLPVDYWRGIHLHRDPRDLLVSAYFSHKTSHPTTSLPGLADHRDALCSTDIESGLLLDMDFYITDNAIRSIVQWPLSARVAQYDAIAMARELSSGNLEMFTRAMDWIDIPVGVEFHAPTFQSLRPKVKRYGADDPEDNTEHYRHGVQGDWQRYFTDRVEQAFIVRYGAVGWTEGS